MGLQEPTTPKTLKIGKSTRSIKGNRHEEPSTPKTPKRGARSTKVATATGFKVTTVSRGAVASAAPPPCDGDKTAEFALLAQLVRDGSDSCKATATTRLMEVADAGDDDTRAQLFAAGAVPPLLDVARTAKAWGTRDHACRCLTSIAGYDASVAVLIVEPLTAILRGASSDASKARACWALGTLADDDDAQRGAKKAIPILVEHLKTGTEDLKLQAAVALWKIGYANDENRYAIALAGGAAPLIKLYRNGDKHVQSAASGALCNLTPFVNSRRIVAEELGISPQSSKFEVDREIVGAY